MSEGVCGDQLVIRAWLHGKRPLTARAYQADVARFFAWSGGALVDVTLDRLQAWDAAMVADAPASRSRRLAAMRSLLNFAHKLGALPTDPGSMLKLPRPDGVRPERILSETEVAAMIGAAPDARARAALRLLYTTGLRASELCGLRWRDLTVLKPSAKPKDGDTGAKARICGKGGKLRTIGIRADVFREIAAISPAPKPDAPVIPGRDGGPLSDDALWRLVRRAAKRAKIGRDVSAHWLRHSCISHALDRGAPVHVAQKNAGHSSLQTTGAYAHVREGDSIGRYLQDT